MLVEYVGIKNLVFFSVKLKDYVFTMRGARLAVDNATATNLVKMWGPQMAEHALFLHLLLAETTLKERGLQLHMAWKQFLLGGNLVEERRLFELIDATRQYKEKIIRRLATGEWLGSAYPTFVKHILRELVYFEEKLAGVEFSPADENAFWNITMSEHATFTAHLLDPTESALSDEAEATSRMVGALPTDGTMASLVMAIDAGVDLDKWNKTREQEQMMGQLQSIIHPTLQSHVIREGEYGLAILRGLIDEDSAPVRPSSNK
jgi:hypothetical protein